MQKENIQQIKTCDMKRHLPSWAKIVKRKNGVPIYNLNIFENIMSWNQENLDIAALDYYGYRITYGELPDKVNEYVCGFKSVGISSSSVVTLCLPVSIENMLSLLALCCIGAISNNVNFLFLKSNLDLYTHQKGSDTLIILDAYLPFVIDDIEKSHIKNIIVTSLNDYLPEWNKQMFQDMSKLPQRLRDVFDDPQKQTVCKEKIAKVRSVRFISMQQIIRLGKENFSPLERGPVDIERDISYSYTSGTTGLPKCIVYKEESANAFIEMHNGLDTKDFVGERVFQIIPLTHATGERVSGYLQMAKGKTLVPQPIYNKDTFGEDVARSRCNWIVAAPSFYLAGVAKGVIAPDALRHVTRPSSGGEPVTKSNVEMIDKWLEENGCKTRFAIGGGAAEDGSGTIFTYFMDEKTKTNETGYPIAPYIKAKIVDESGHEVKRGERGILHISSPAAADRYLNDTDATAARWYIGEDGFRWGVTGDIAVQNPDGSYNILGRASDSYTDQNGNRVYLFDIEYSLDINDPVIEWEITAHKLSNDTAVVAQVVLKNEYLHHKAHAIRYLCNKYSLDAVKIYDNFEISDVTGKRDFQKLKGDKEGYYTPVDDMQLARVSYLDGNRIIEEIITDCDL